MFDLKIINSVIDQLEEERGIPREKTLEAIESSLATAYKKEYGKRGQIVRANFDINTGTTEFYQVKIVVDESMVKMEEDEEEADLSAGAEAEADERVRFNPEHHILIEDAVKIKKDSKLEDELVFPLEEKEDFGRIAAQTAKQIIMQKIREAEKVSVLDEFGQRQGEIVNGTVQRIERGNIFVDFGRATGLLSYDEQIKGESYKQGERIRAYLSSVEESPKGVFLRLSRAHPKFLEKLFEIETPELANKTVEIKAIAREAGSRSKIAIASNDEHIDPVGSLVGQRGVRVSTVMSELGGEKIDIIKAGIGQINKKRLVGGKPLSIVSITTTSEDLYIVGSKTGAYKGQLMFIPSGSIVLNEPKEEYSISSLLNKQFSQELNLQLDNRSQIHYEALVYDSDFGKNSKDLFKSLLSNETFLCLLKNPVGFKTGKKIIAPLSCFGLIEKRVFSANSTPLISSPCIPPKTNAVCPSSFPCAIATGSL